jgi:ABC transporter substrate binding protein
LFIARRAQIAEFALRQKTALFATFREDAAAGALMAFGFNLDAQWRLGAGYVDQILKGTSPADLPVQQPTMFETIINLKTAKAIGIEVPTSLLLSADDRQKWQIRRPRSAGERPSQATASMSCAISRVLTGAPHSDLPTVYSVQRSGLDDNRFTAICGMDGPCRRSAV